jgi:hypothetical protein
MALLSRSDILLSICIAIQLFLSVNAFVPDYVLRVSVGTLQQDCQPRLSTLINGTYPGPPIYLEPDVTTWIRVYNDADVNATMVGAISNVSNTTADDVS